MWVRYIDDIFIISTTPLSLILDKCNIIDKNIKFTCELPIASGDIPFLDTLVHFKNQSVNIDITCELYSKPMHSGHVLPWISHVPLQQKMALLRTERLRTIRNCTSSELETAAIERHKERFISNGYPKKVVEEHYCKNGSSSRRKDRRKDNGKVIYLRYPYINEKYAIKIRNILKKTKLPVPIKPIFITAAPLRTQLRKSNPEAIKHACISEDSCICLKKNIVYEITCKICQEKYIGETHRTLLTRIKEHHKSSSSQYYDHFIKKHHMAPEMTSFKISQGGFSNTLQRKAAETKLIKVVKPSINIQNSSLLHVF